MIQKSQSHVFCTQRALYPIYSTFVDTTKAEAVVAAWCRGCCSVLLDIHRYNKGRGLGVSESCLCCDLRFQGLRKQEIARKQVAIERHESLCKCIRQVRSHTRMSHGTRRGGLRAAKARKIVRVSHRRVPRVPVLTINVTRKARHTQGDSWVERSVRARRREAPPVPLQVGTKSHRTYKCATVHTRGLQGCGRYEISLRYLWARGGMRYCARFLCVTFHTSRSPISVPMFHTFRSHIVEDILESSQRYEVSALSCTHHEMRRDVLATCMSQRYDAEVWGIAEGWGSVG